MSRSVIGYELIFDPYKTELVEKVCTINKKDNYGN